MYIPVALVLGAKGQFAGIVAEKFYGSGNAVVLSGSDSQLLESIHKDLSNSDWVKTIVNEQRSSESGARIAEFAVKEYLQFNWIISCAEYTFSAQAMRSDGGLLAEVQNKLIAVFDEALTAALHANKGCTVVISVSIADKGDDYEREATLSELRKWLHRQKEERIARISGHCIKLHVVLWTAQDKAYRIEDVAQLARKLCAPTGETLVS